jgi:hypothetical protein
MRQKECVTQRRNDRSRQGVFARPPWEERDDGVIGEGRHCERVYLSAKLGGSRRFLGLGQRGLSLDLEISDVLCL